MRHLLSCSNCWYNGLQSGAVGSSLGYCAEYDVVLRRADETTCARQLRKDLLFDSSLASNVDHRRSFRSEDSPQLLADARRVTNGEFVESDKRLLRGEAVARVVAEYGEYGTKIESLAQLRALPGARAELAMTSLARAYTKRCCDRGGNWTSGVHLLWWTRLRLEEVPQPEIGLGDLRHQLPVDLSRQVELAAWWILMLRLVFISDVGSHARAAGHAVGSLADLAERAAEATTTPSVRKLSVWIRKKGLSAIDAVLPERGYRELARELHRERSHSDVATP